MYEIILAVNFFVMGILEFNAELWTFTIFFTARKNFLITTPSPSFVRREIPLLRNED
jgi:hypothetical protein